MAHYPSNLGVRTRRHRYLGVVVFLALTASACSNSDDGATVRDLGAGSDDASASSSAPAVGSVAPGEAVDREGGYLYASDVTAHRQVTADVCEIKALLGSEPADFSGALAIYRDGENSVNSDGTLRTLAGFASATDRRHGLDTYFGTAAPLDEWISAALTGEGQFATTGDPIRSQAAEKGIQNQLMVAWTIHELRSALAAADEGNIDPATGAPHNWDEAWAFYHGANPDCAPWATANSRAQNFGTTADDGQTALANLAIVDAMNSGREALLVGDSSTAAEAANEVIRNLVITYSQASIRYATLVENDVSAGDADAAAEHRIEGLAFLRVIEPILAEHGADVATLRSVFDLEADPASNGGGDEVAAALAPALEALGISDSDIGVLQD